MLYYNYGTDQCHSIISGNYPLAVIIVTYTNTLNHLLEGLKIVFASWLVNAIFMYNFNVGSVKGKIT